MNGTTETKTVFEKKIDDNIAEIRRFIEETITTGEYRDQEEFWAEFSDEIDICFSEDDDEASPFVGAMNFYAYPLITDGDGKVSTDTSEFVKISMKQENDKPAVWKKEPERSAK